MPEYVFHVSFQYYRITKGKLGKMREICKKEHSMKIVYAIFYVEKSAHISWSSFRMSHPRPDIGNMCISDFHKYSPLSWWYFYDFSFHTFVVWLFVVVVVIVLPGHSAQFTLLFGFADDTARCHPGGWCLSSKAVRMRWGYKWCSVAAPETHLLNSPHSYPDLMRQQVEYVLTEWKIFHHIFILLLFTCTKSNKILEKLWKTMAATEERQKNCFSDESCNNNAYNCCLDVSFSLQDILLFFIIT